MIYARVVVFSFLFVALYILRFYSLSFALSPLLSRSYVYVIFFSFSLSVCVRVCVSAISCLAPWVSRSIDRSFDRLIDSSVGGSRVTLSSFLSWCPLSLNYLYIYFMQPVVVTSKILKYFSFFFSSMFVFVEVMLPVSLIGSRSRSAEDCPLMLMRRLLHNHL